MKYSKKVNQFRNLSRKINEMLAGGTWQELSSHERGHLKSKLQQLYNIARTILAAKEVRRILAAAAALLCISTSANAQVFAPPVYSVLGITTNAEYITPAFVDIDNDGDQDLFLYEYGGIVNFYQNTGTAALPVYGVPQSNPFGLALNGNTLRFEFADLDGDGDYDIMAGEYYGDHSFYENTGTSSMPSFAAQQVNPFGLVSVNQQALLTMADLDNDGDLDLLDGVYYGSLDYFENTGTAVAPVFAAAQINPFGLTVVNDLVIPVFVDLDEDGDYDVLSSVYYGDFYYFENTGTAASPAYAAAVLNPFGLSDTLDIVLPAFADLDDDGDQDLFFGSPDGGLGFIENLSASGISSEKVPIVPIIYPNPATDRLNIEILDNREGVIVALFDGTGRCVLRNEYFSNKISLDIADFAPGLYALEISDGDRINRKKVIIK